MNAILSATVSILRNAIFPAAYVAIGHVAEIEKKLPTFSLDSIKRFNITSALSKINNPSFIEQFTWGNVKEVFNFNLSNLTSDKHLYEIGTAAAIGASATLINEIFKRVSFFRDAPKTRVLFSISAAFIGVYAASKYSDFQISPDQLTDIAIKIGIIGGLTKVTMMTTRIGLTTIRGSSNWILTGIINSCDFGIAVTNLFDWGSLPKSEAVSDKNLEKNVKKKKVFKTPTTSPLKRTPKKQEKEIDEELDLSDSEPPATFPLKRTHKTPQKDRTEVDSKPPATSPRKGTPKKQESTENLDSSSDSDSPEGSQKKTQPGSKSPGKPPLEKEVSNPTESPGNLELSDLDPTGNNTTLHLSESDGEENNS